MSTSYRPHPSSVLPTSIPRLFLFVVLFGSIGLVENNRSVAEDQQPAITEFSDFDVVIAGGSTAAFAAAVAAAESGARTALLEPTDWVGGQLTSSGVPAIDEAWHTIKATDDDPELKVGVIARYPENITPCFLQSLTGLSEQGDCWVSRFCFRPKIYLEEQLLPLQAKAGNNLVVFLETVVKQVELDETGSSILAISAIRRAAPEGGAYDRLPSEDLADWYSPKPSKNFAKQSLRFVSQPGAKTVFIDATEWGEVLALSGKEYLQGVEDKDGGLEGDDTCGQATVFCFVQELHAEDVSDSVGTLDDTLGYGDYQDREKAWELIWTYRRIRGEGDPAIGDLCLQNWGYSGRLQEGGNDYPFGYLFKSKKQTAEETVDWQGGIDLEVLAASERRAYDWHDWFRQNAPEPFRETQFSLAGDELGTGHGLAKLPYIRDTRRAIGLDGFLLKFSDLSGRASEMSGTEFPDRVALGAYPADVHPLVECTIPAYVSSVHDTLPFYIPFRALTHQDLGNLLVAGKTMAQSFLANSATRLHPIEWSSGTAAGVAAAYMAEQGKTSREAYEFIGELQELIRHKTPIDWTIEPTPSE